MKKLINKIKNRKAAPLSSRITTETVAEHREQILAGGRKFKYPIQYAKHKLVINAIIISVAAVLVAVLIGWWQLYVNQNTSEFMYNITKVFPVPVAKIDGQNVRYSDYLLKYRSSAHYLEQKEQVNLSTDDGKRQLEYIKRQALNDSIADAYAIKLAKSLNVSVTDEEVNTFLKEQRQTSDGEISEQTYNAVILDYYGWNSEEYAHVTKNKLIRQKVSYLIDKDALSTINTAYDETKKDSSINFKDLASSISKKTNIKTVYGSSGWISKINQDGGLSVAAAKLNKQAISTVIKSSTGNGYYIIRLLDINDMQVSYEYIQVPLTKFSNQLTEEKDNKKVTEYISVSKS